jgi:hypothetical protein
MSDYKPLTIGELIKNLSEFDPNEIVIGAIFTAEHLVFFPDEDAEDEITPSQELMSVIAENYDNSDEAIYLSEALVGWAIDNYKENK